MISNETTLSVLAGSNPQERVAVVLCVQASGSSYLEMRQQSWGEGVGWYTQSKVLLEPEQVADLRDTLGKSQRQSPPRNILPRDSMNVRRGFVPRVVHAETA